MTSHHRYPRRLLAALSVTVVAAAMVIGAGSASAAPPSSDPTPAKAVAPAAHTSLTADTSKLVGGLAALKAGRQQVFVQLAGQGAADASTAASSKGAAGMKAAASSAKAAAKSRAAKVFGTAHGTDAKARQLFQVGNAVPGFAVDADVAAITAMAASADVVKISPLIAKTYSDTNGAALTNVLATWQNTGNYGAGVRVGIIDTGLDFTHSDFGGSGQVSDWDAAHGNNTNANWYQTLTAKAKTKVGGGYDFVGDDYNADDTAADYQPVPHPDADPIDCAEHGTHVAGILAGFGVNADGSTFAGKYNQLTAPKLNTMKISPGMAPAATIYSLKVFGCTGSTNEVIPALDWALDPNGDGNFSDHLDIINMSLGSDYGVADDPENDVVDALTRHGVLSVIAMGNGGDLTDIGGSPGNALTSLAVASSVDADQPLNKLQVDAPTAGTVDGQVSIAYDWANNGPSGQPVTGDVVALSAANADGCGTISSADAAAIAGKVAWLTWDSDSSTRRCGSTARSDNVAGSGAIGAIFTGDVNPFAAGISGTAKIPVFQLTPTATAALAPSVGSGLRVTFNAQTAAIVNTTDPSITDLVSSFSSRGSHGSIGSVKPDVAAPGDTIISAFMGSGTDGVSLGGTSMATPHTAGIAALVKSVHKNWSPEQVKAAVMNTANHDLYSQPNQSGPIYGPARDGAGRVDALGAVSTSILAYDTDRDLRGGVSASFGVVEAPITASTITKTRTVTIQNTGSSAANLSLSYAAAITEPGVSYQVSPSTVRVGARSSATVRVTLTVKPSQLRHTIDPTMATDQIGVPRNYVSDASGRLVISQSGKAKLRVPVYAAVKPVSQTSASDSIVGHGDKSPAIKLSGKGFAQGSGSTAWESLVSVMDLGATSPKLPECHGKITTNCVASQSARAGDIQYVGAGTAAGFLYFGVSTYANWAAVDPAMIPYILIDTNADGRPDFEIDVQIYPDTDVLLAELFRLSDGKNLDLQPVNFQFGDVDTNLFDSNVLLVPVNPNLLGIPSGATTFPITYTVATYSGGYLAVNADGDIDSVGPVSYDVLNPKVQLDAPFYSDQGNTTIPYALGVSSSTAKAATLLGKVSHKGGWGHHPSKDKGVKALVLHLHGASGQRAQVVTLKG